MDDKNKNHLQISRSELNYDDIHPIFFVVTKQIIFVVRKPTVECKKKK